MEERAQVADRRLLARLVLIREELRGMMAGGIHDPRSNTRVLGNLPQKEVSRQITGEGGLVRREPTCSVPVIIKLSAESNKAHAR
jgi:hypothetical protein